MTAPSGDSFDYGTPRAYSVAVIYDGDAVEIEVLAHSAAEAMEKAETATSELRPGWQELVLIVEPEPISTYTRKET